MENGSQNGPKSIGFSYQKSILFATFSEDRFWDAFWSPFGSLLAPFWPPLAPFGLPLAPFWLPLAHFLFLLAHFYSPWGSIFSLWASPGVVFGAFPIFSTKISWKIMFFFVFSRNVLLFTHPLPQNTRRLIEGAPLRKASLPLHSILSHLGPERNLAVGNLDPLRAQVGLVSHFFCSLPS